MPVASFYVFFDSLVEIAIDSRAILKRDKFAYSIIKFHIFFLCFVF